MFETYLIHQRVDPQLRRRLSLALGAAVFGSVASVCMLWATQKMNVSRVGAPTSDFLIFSMDDLPPPPPKAPPAAPAAAAPAPASEPVPAEPELFESPEHTPTELPRARRDAGAVLRSAGAGNPFGPLGGDATSVCVVGCGTGVARKVSGDDEGKSPPEVDFSALTCRVCPDPPQKQLQQTASAMLGKRGVDGRTRFCVDANGRVDAVSIVESSGDPEVDRVLAATVRGWRFAPMRVDGRPRKTCSSASFDIHFE